MEKKPFKERLKRKIKEIRTDLKNKTVAIVFFALAGFSFWILVQLLYLFYGFSIVAWVKSIPYATTIFSHLFTQITAQTKLGIFYLFTGSSLFFLPVPLELLYINYLKQGFAVNELLPIVLMGIIAGQFINYFLGRFFSFIFISFIKKKTRKKIKHRLEKYSTTAILSAHILPFPFQIFNFVSGVLKYKFFRLFFFMTIGLIIKHIAVYFIYLKFF